MSLRKHLIASLATAALAIPAASVSFVAFTAAPAFAKGGKGGGGNGGGGAGKSRGGEDRGSRGKSGTRGGGFGKSGQGGVASGNRGQGQGNSGARGQAARGTAKAATTLAPETSAPAPMRPNELGSMNGALNANINAVLAHIRNGNTNGPVGALAGLAVADHDASGAQDVVDLGAQHTALDAALADAGYETLADYEAAAETEGFEPVPAIDEALEALGDAVDDEPPTAEEIAEAEAALAALGDAEANVFAAWNKSDAATDEEKAALLEALRDRLAADNVAIDAAIGSAEADDGAEPSVDDEAATTPEELPEGEEAAELDPEVEEMIDNLKF